MAEIEPGDVAKVARGIGVILGGGGGGPEGAQAPSLFALEMH